ncbi:hypothetical protein F7Q99_36695 [Streptomyces kaniharaensis]|uniref:DUF2637 domain-containing protein n=1 Tax=Streptomyces kaniharaensis TaxID=212423 RepID=A0A6N7L1F8_9ACTN|nr:hypothetical protein [Streptomyces kaniharaensis]MQS17580.1 hypothetical protein [Streptomyces kaniharaensis]
MARTNARRTRPAAKSTPSTRSKPDATQQDPSPPTAEQILATAQAQIGELLATAERNAGELLAQAVADADRQIATATQWSEESEQLRAEAAESADRLTAAADRQAEQILAAARRQAEHITTEAMAAADVERDQATAEGHAAADRLVEDATQRAAQLLEEAETAAGKVRADANDEAKALVAAAEEQARTRAATIADEAQATANQLLRKAERDAEATGNRAADELADVQARIEQAKAYLTQVCVRADEAREGADLIVAERHRQASRIHLDAITTAEATLDSATQTAEEIRTTASATARKILADAAEEADRTRCEAEQQGEHVIETARADADAIRLDAQDDARQLREQAQAEAVDIRKEAAEEADAIRSRGIEEVNRHRKKAEESIAGDRHAAATARGKAEGEAQSIRNKAQKDADKLASDAEEAASKAEARVQQAESKLEELRAEQQRREAAAEARHNGRFRRAMRRLWARRPTRLEIVLWCGVAYTARHEHDLAQMAGAGDYLAWALAICVDVWLVEATRAKAKVETRIALTVVTMCQIASLLASLHMLGVAPDANGEWQIQWALAVPLAMVVPIVIWRVHELEEHVKAARKRAHDERNTPEPASGPLIPDTVGAHEGGSPRPPVSEYEAPSAHPVSLPAQAAHGARSHERAISADQEGGSAHPERPMRALESGDAHDAQVLSAKALLMKRKAAVRPLYDALRTRPTAKQIYAVLTAQGLLNGTEEGTRGTCQRVRDAIEADEPGLRPLSGARS